MHVVRAGAAGFLLKDSASAEMLAAVRALASGRGYFGTHASKVLAQQVQKPHAQLDDPYRDLTSREREVFHLIVEGMTTYPGLPVPSIRPHLRREDSEGKYAPGVTFAIDIIELCGNTGTYIDSPFHRYADGKDLSELPLESVADLECLVVRVDTSRGAAIDCALPGASTRRPGPGRPGTPRRPVGRAARRGRPRSRRRRRRSRARPARG